MYDIIDAIMGYESGMLEEEEVVEFFQKLIDNDKISSLRGHYGRTANALIEAGYCTESA